MCGECNWPMSTKDKSVTKITLRNGLEIEVKGISQQRFQEIKDLIDSRSEQHIDFPEIFHFPARSIVKMERLT